MMRTIAATSIRDTDYNALGSYFMVHVILRLNRVGRYLKNPFRLKPQQGLDCCCRI